MLADPENVVVIPRPSRWRWWYESFDYKFRDLDYEHPHSLEELMKAFQGKRLVPGMCKNCLEHHLVSFSRDCMECGSKDSMVTVFELETYS